MFRALTPAWFLSLLAVIVGINVVAYTLHLYFYIWWLDIVVHTLSGFWVGAFMTTVIVRSLAPVVLSSHRWIIFWAALGVTMTIGVVWEMFEFSFDQFVRFAPHEMGDTFSDLLCDLLGGITGSLLPLSKRYTGRHE